MGRWKQIIMTLAVVAGLSAAVQPVGDALAINVIKEQCSQSTTGSQSVCNAAVKDNATDMAKTIINTLLYVLGIIAVIMIVVGGIRYTTSAGDASRIKAAKDTIMYSVVGLVVALLAFAIVNFVLGRFN